FADAAAFRHLAQADDFVRPFRFAGATWIGLNHAVVKGLAEPSGASVRSMTVLAWDVLATLIGLFDLPTSVYAAVRGNVGAGNTFADLSGSAALPLRFSDDAAACITISDRFPPAAGGEAPRACARTLLLWGSGGTITLRDETYEFCDEAGRLIDKGP